MVHFYSFPDYYNGVFIKSMAARCRNAKALLESATATGPFILMDYLFTPIHKIVCMPPFMTPNYFTMLQNVINYSFHRLHLPDPFTVVPKCECFLLHTHKRDLTLCVCKCIYTIIISCHSFLSLRFINCLSINEPVFLLQICQND